MFYCLTRAFSLFSWEGELYPAKANNNSSFKGIFEPSLTIELSLIEAASGDSAKVFRNDVRQSVAAVLPLLTPTIARFSLSGRAPKLTESIVFAERVHAALLELLDGSSTLTGCDGVGRPSSTANTPSSSPNRSRPSAGWGRGDPRHHLLACRLWLSGDRRSRSPP